MADNALSRFKIALDADRCPAQNVIPAPNFVAARVLAANTAEVHTVPTGAKYVVFSGTTDFYARFGAAAAVPADDVTDGTASELNPVARSIEGYTTIGVIAPATCVLTLAFYS
jgi:hypothetical protein